MDVIKELSNSFTIDELKTTFPFTENEIKAFMEFDNFKFDDFTNLSNNVKDTSILKLIIEYKEKDIELINKIKDICKQSETIQIH